jgi:hypothetical protein
MDADQNAALRKPFPPEQIGKLPKGGIQLDFVGHADVTDRLLEVDPEWTWVPMGLTPEQLPALDRFGNLWGYITICGVTRPAVGDGNSMKECISDLIRNGAMRAGVALDLWAKGDRTFGLAGHDAPRQAQAVGGPTDEATAKDALKRKVWVAALAAGLTKETLPGEYTAAMGGDISTATVDDLEAFHGVLVLRAGGLTDTPPPDVRGQDPGAGADDLAREIANTAREAHGEKPALTKALLRAHREHVAGVVVTRDGLTLEQFIAAESKKVPA